MGKEASEPVLLTDLLDQAAAKYPERMAMDFMGRLWRYREVEAMVGRLCASLIDLGLATGDRVVLCLPNTPYFVIAYFAVLRAGGVVVSMNPLYTSKEMTHLIRDSGSQMAFVPDVADIYDRLAAVEGISSLIVCPMAQVLPLSKSIAYRVLNRAKTARPTAKDKRVRWFKRLLAGGSRAANVARASSDVAVLQYTGGTTGFPKGAALTHGSLVANCLQTAKHDTARPTYAETTLGVLPMFHVFALTTVLNYSVCTASRIVLLPRFEMKSFLAAMRRTLPQRLYVVPTILTALNGLSDNKMPPTNQLRLCISGGAPLPSEVRERFFQRTGCRVLEGYGLSEASPIVTCNPTTGGDRDGSAGVPLPGTTIEIRSVETGALLTNGELGEVCVRGPQVMEGYWNRPDETREVLDEGLLRTGDIGYLDTDGYLFLVDRIKDLILCGGYNVYPRIIEDALYAHPDVDEATVIGVPDAYRGEAPKAFIKLKEGSQTDEVSIRKFLALHISKIEMPRDIEFRSELPKTLIGKLSKRELRET